eukprot:462494_1
MISFNSFMDYICQMTILKKKIIGNTYMNAFMISYGWMDTPISVEKVYGGKYQIYEIIKTQKKPHTLLVDTSHWTIESGIGTHTMMNDENNMGITPDSNYIIGSGGGSLYSGGYTGHGGYCGYDEEIYSKRGEIGTRKGTRKGTQKIG